MYVDVRHKPYLRCERERKGEQENMAQRPLSSPTAASSSSPGAKNGSTPTEYC